MKNDSEFVAHCLELMEGMGDSLASRRMFGGHGIFLESMMFALIADGELYFKADPANDSHFDALDLPFFTYLRGGKEARLGYRLAPESAFQNNRAMREWAKLGWQAAVRADEATPPSKRKRRAG